MQCVLEAFVDRILPELVIAIPLPLFV